MSNKMTLKTIGRMSEDDARSFFEGLRWPGGEAVCPHCGVVGEAAKVEKLKATSKARAGLWECRACAQQFTVTVGSVMEGSHLPLTTWLQAFFLLSAAKKSISALEVQRLLGIGSYRSAWHLCHRIRFAMANHGDRDPFRGDVEADETYVGGKPRHRVYGARKKDGKTGRGTTKQPVAVLVERNGRARARVIPNVNGTTLKGFVRENVDKSARILTDEWNGYRGLSREFEGGHETTMHSIKQYAKPGGIHSNTAESFFSLLKRGVVGQFHHVSKEHLQRYCDEFAYRWSHRNVSDTERTERAIKQGDGVRLYYKKPRGGEGASEGLVANG